jgi:hypothetical protein
MSAWNEAQSRAVLSGLLDVQHRLEEIESLLARSLTVSPFTQFIDDLSPSERRAIHEQMAQVRSTILALLDESGIPLEVCRTSLRRVLQGHLIDLHSSLVELGPPHLSGYGPLSETAQTQALHVQQTLTQKIDKLQTHLRQGAADV